MLSIDGLAKQFASKRGLVTAVDDVSLHVQPGHLFTLLGPSGCGKTTTLRCVAGLEVPDSGSITADGRTLFSRTKRINVPANQRGLGMVFQSYAIWPHMNVFKNVAFPLTVEGRNEKRSKPQIKGLVERVLAVVQLHDLAGRPATDLSGGQQQRLALARALVMEPSILLLDEPLSNLDAKLRESMRFELKRLQSELGITSIYVTHDQSEALALSDVIAVMNEGKVEQVGTPREIYGQPKTRFVADFIGTSNFLAGSIVEAGPAECLVHTAAGDLMAKSGLGLVKGTDVIVAFRPGSVKLQLGMQGASSVSHWHGVVNTALFLGELIDLEVQVGAERLRVRLPASMHMSSGDQVTVVLNPEDCSILGRD